VAFSILASACGFHGEREHAAGPPRSPEAAAVELFALARLPVPPKDSESGLLAAGPKDMERPALAAALRALAPAQSPRVIAVAPLDVAERTAVDLEARLPGGGTLRCSVQVLRLADGTWRVAWFETPSGSWPRHRAGPGDGLTSSSPPR
jgi:hypothetical protein